VDVLQDRVLGCETTREGKRERRAGVDDVVGGRGRGRARGQVVRSDD